MRLRNFLATLALAGAVACSDDRGPTAPTNELDNQTPTTAQAARGPLVIQNVSGTLSDGGTFAGTLTITQITRVGNQLFASGSLVGTATQGTTVTQISQTFSNLSLTSPAALLDLAQAGRTCRILHLDVGPIFLDLLGLQVDLSRIVLDITAVSGAGNLLGNLLCALAGLLDNTPLNLTAIDRLLAQINAILGAL